MGLLILAPCLQSSSVAVLLREHCDRALFFFRVCFLYLVIWLEGTYSVLEYWLVQGDPLVVFMRRMEGGMEEGDGG